MTVKIKEALSRIIWIGSRAKRNGTLKHAEESVKKLKKVQEDSTHSTLIMKKLKSRIILSDNQCV